MTITRWNGTNGFNGCHGEQGRPQESHGRSADSAGASMLQTPTRTGWPSPLVIAHMAVESARLVAGNEGTATMPAAGFRKRAGYHRTRTTRCPSMGAVRVPGSTRHQDARMSLVFVSGSDWPPAPARFNAPRGGLRAAGICNQFVAAQVEETEPWSTAGLWPGRRDSVDAGGGSRAAETRAAGENWLR